MANDDKAAPAEETGTAEQWLARLYSGSATEEDRKAFAVWLRSDEAHAKAYKEAERVWRELGYALDAETLPAPSRPVEVIPAVPLRRFRPAMHLDLTGSAKIAAGLLLAVALAYVFFAGRGTLYESGIGEIRTIALSDGTEVMLGPSSELRARVSASGRHVELTRGGAYFKVAHDTARPFTVRAANARITVVGTEFDVLMRPKTVRVSVNRGIVDVSPAVTPALPGAPGGTARLTAGRQVVTGEDGSLGAVQDFDPGTAFGWREGWLKFVDAPLEDVVADVNRYRASKITIADPALFDLRVTAAFPADQTDRLLSSLAVSQSVAVESGADGVVIRGPAGGPR